MGVLGEVKMSITVQVEIGSYEVGRRIDVVVPDETLESAQLAFREVMNDKASG